MKKTALICFALGLSAQSFGQSLTQLWTGLQAPQPQSELPVSNLIRRSGTNILAVHITVNAKGNCQATGQSLPAERNAAN